MFKKKARLFLIVLLLLPSLICTANIELTLLNNQARTVKPGGNVSCLIKLANNSNGGQSFSLRINEDAAGIRLVSDNRAVILNPEQSINKIITLKVPDSCPAGDYSVSVEAYDNQNPTVSEKVDIPLKVESHFELLVSTLKKPTFVFSGDSVSCSFLIKNASNLDVVVKTSIFNGSKNITEQHTLIKDSNLIIDYSFVTTMKMVTSTKLTLLFMASILDKTGTEKSEAIPIDIIPINNVKFDKYERFPVKVSGIGAVSNRYGNEMMSGLFDVKGEGSVGSTGNHSIDFHLRGPDRSGNPLFGLNDEYYLKYNNKHLNLVVGDNNFGLSQLTESTRNGRGLELGYTFNKLMFRGYYTSPRYYPQIKHVYAVQTSYILNQKNGIELGLLTKIDSANLPISLYTLSAYTSPISWYRLSGEIAYGKQNGTWTNAYNVSTGIQFKVFTLHATYTKAEANFPGYLSNSLRLNAGATLQLKRFSLSANYDQNSTSFALDTIYTNMPLSKNINLSGNLKLTPNNTISIGGYSNSMQDRAPIPLFDYTRTYGRISTMNRWGIVNTSLFADFGKMENRRVSTGQELSFFYNSSFSFSAAFSKSFSMAIYANYQGGKINVTGYDRFYYGGYITRNIKDKLTFSLQYNSNYEWKYYTSDRSIFSMEMSGHLNKKNNVSLLANYNLVKNSLDNKEYTLQLKYTHTIDLPIAKKKNIGSVIGRIINKGVESVSGIKITLNGLSTMTDANGQFKYPALPVGSHFLTLDYSKLGLNTITESLGPLSVVVEPGIITQYEVALTKSGEIIGKLSVKEDERANQKGFIPVKEKIDKLVVEANNGKQIFRVYTDKDGNFRFSDLLPGEWKVVIYTKGLPLGYQLVTSTFNLTIEPGEREDIQVMIEKKARQIQFQTKN